MHALYQSCSFDFYVCSSKGIIPGLPHPSNNLKEARSRDTRPAIPPLTRNDRLVSVNSVDGSQSWCGVWLFSVQSRTRTTNCVTPVQQGIFATCRVGSRIMTARMPHGIVGAPGHPATTLIRRVAVNVDSSSWPGIIVSEGHRAGRSLPVGYKRVVVVD